MIIKHNEIRLQLIAVFVSISIAATTDKIPRFGDRYDELGRLNKQIKAGNTKNIAARFQQKINDNNAAPPPVRRKLNSTVAQTVRKPELNGATTLTSQVPKDLVKDKVWKDPKQNEKFGSPSTHKTTPMNFEKRPAVEQLVKVSKPIEKVIVADKTRDDVTNSKKIEVRKADEAVHEFPLIPDAALSAATYHQGPVFFSQIEPNEIDETMPRMVNVENFDGPILKTNDEIFDFKEISTNLEMNDSSPVDINNHKQKETESKEPVKMEEIKDPFVVPEPNSNLNHRGSKSTFDSSSDGMSSSKLNDLKHIEKAETGNYIESESSTNIPPPYEPTTEEPPPYEIDVINDVNEPHSQIDEINLLSKDMESLTADTDEHEKAVVKITEVQPLEHIEPMKKSVIGVEGNDGDRMEIIPPKSTAEASAEKTRTLTTEIPQVSSNIADDAHDQSIISDNEDHVTLPEVSKESVIGVDVNDEPAVEISLPQGIETDKEVHKKSIEKPAELPFNSANEIDETNKSQQSITKSNDPVELDSISIDKIDPKVDVSENIKIEDTIIPPLDNPTQKREVTETETGIKIKDENDSIKDETMLQPLGIVVQKRKVSKRIGRDSLVDRKSALVNSFMKTGHPLGKGGAINSRFALTPTESSSNKETESSSTSDRKPPKADHNDNKISKADHRAELPAAERKKSAIPEHEKMLESVRKINILSVDSHNSAAKPKDKRVIDTAALLMNAFRRSGHPLGEREGTAHSDGGLIPKRAVNNFDTELNAQQHNNKTAATTLKPAEIDDKKRKNTWTKFAEFSKTLDKRTKNMKKPSAAPKESRSKSAVFSDRKIVSKPPILLNVTRKDENEVKPVSNSGNTSAKANRKANRGDRKVKRKSTMTATVNEGREQKEKQNEGSGGSKNKGIKNKKKRQPDQQPADGRGRQKKAGKRPEAYQNSTKKNDNQWHVDEEESGEQWDVRYIRKTGRSDYGSSEDMTTKAGVSRNRTAKNDKTPRRSKKQKRREADYLADDHDYYGGNNTATDFQYDYEPHHRNIAVPSRKRNMDTMPNGQKGRGKRIEAPTDENELYDIEDGGAWTDDDNYKRRKGRTDRTRARNDRKSFPVNQTGKSKRITGGAVANKRARDDRKDGRSSNKRSAGGRQSAGDWQRYGMQLSAGGRTAGPQGGIRLMELSESSALPFRKAPAKGKRRKAS